MTGRVAIVLLTRDLRVHDHPALATACAAFDPVVPLYVLDPTLAELSPNRTRFLHQSLADLREALRARGGDLVVRQGDPVAETIRLAGEVGAEGVGLSADVSRYAQRRLRAECERHRLSLRLFPVSPSSSRGRCARPTGESPDAAPGGERVARRRLSEWLPTLDRYDDSHDDSHDDMAGDRTSRLSPYLRFGCLSPLTVANRAGDRAGLGRGQGGAPAVSPAGCRAARTRLPGPVGGPRRRPGLAPLTPSRPQRGGTGAAPGTSKRGRTGATRPAGTLPPSPPSPAARV
ncbi:deoxyribodipyrimidine photo-lyase [Micromonospora globispora]|uniref:deoxyribodipyrimidine photo-lyase n=1 Tax=Micromonospora globispora TaxID=1450148 RepID=UPI001FB01953|nr:deoxyribodipyrimidine photo-lyase [Micromonospora globispora]